MLKNLFKTKTTPTLGNTYIDKITGFAGIAVGHVEYISGCNQTLVVPKVNTEGVRVDGEWFDDQRLKLLGDINKVVLDNKETPGSDTQAPLR